MRTNSKNSRLYSPILLAVLALLLGALVACGGNDAPAEEQAAATAESAANQPEQPAADTPAPVAADPTGVPPTAAPPTAEPATEEPAGGISATGGCGNAYYPVVDGLVMNYTTSAGELGDSRYSTSFSNVTVDSFTLTTAISEGDFISTDWVCTDGGLLSPEFNQAPGGLEGLEIEFVEATGFTIPPEDMFQIGETWSTHYVANATMDVADTDPVTMVQTIDMTNTVVGVEAVSVPIGNFPEAVVVETITTIDIATDFLGTAQPGMTMEMSYKSWYVEGIGLVRQEMTDLFDDAGGGYITELVSIFQAQ